MALKQGEPTQAFKKAYKILLDKNNGNPNKKNIAYELAMAAVLKQFNTGVALSKKDASGKFKPIVVNTVVSNPNKPNKKEYVQECL